MVSRIIQEGLTKAIKTSKVVMVSGPKRAGKEILVNSILDHFGIPHVQIDCNSDINTAELLKDENSREGNVLVLNDAEHIEGLQEVIDKALSGESTSTIVLLCSFPPRVDNELIEALKLSGLYFKVYAPSFYEAANHFGLPNEEQLLEERLIYGNYPEVLDDLAHAELTLRELLKEVINTHLGINDRINKNEKLWRTLQVLAFTIGEPISYHEVGERVGIDNETVMRYVDLLEKADILIRLNSYSSGKRYELKKSNCIYFLDNGIRNALISNFNPTFLRNDMEVLWKNYLVAERMKWVRMNGWDNDFFFWRTHTRQQIDILEINGDQFTGFKTDWERRKKVKIPKYFKELYPTVTTKILNRSTYWSFLSKKQ